MDKSKGLVFFLFLLIRGEAKMRVVSKVVDNEGSGLMYNNRGILKKAICILLSITLTFSPVAFAMDNSIQEKAFDDTNAVIELIAPTIASETKLLGNDTENILEWVTNKVGTDLYTGVMRGAKGTFLAKAGNAADKALLLREMLRISDPDSKYRFATCTLSTEQAEQILGAAFSYRAAQQILPVEVAFDAAKQAQDPEVRGVLESIGREWQALIEEAQSESAHLAKTLDTFGFKFDISERDRLKELVSRHIWLQQLKGNEWIDLDPTLSQLKLGDNHCKIEATMEELPSELYHQLTVKVRLEERDGNTLRSRYVLEKDWPVADIVQMPLTLIHAGVLGFGDAISNIPDNTPEGMESYTPILRIGEHYEVGESYFLPKPLSAPSDSTTKVVKGFAATLDDVLALDSEKPENVSQLSESGVVAEFLELEISTPNGERKSWVSPVFDRIGFVARETGTGASEPLKPLIEVDGEYQPLMTLWNLALWTGRVMPEQQNIETAYMEDEPVIGLVKFLGWMNQSYYVLRKAIFEKIQPVSSPLITTSPGISLLGWMPLAEQDGDLIIDLVSNPSKPSISSTSTASEWAVSSVLAERFLVSLGGYLAETPPLHKVDVVSIFRNARKDQISLKLLKPADTGKAQNINASGEARVRITSELDAGQTLLVPERAIASTSKIGWWLVDTANGVVRDEMENGRHSPAMEKAETNLPGLRSLRGFRTFGQRVCLALNRTLLVLALVGGEGDIAWSAVKAEAKVLKEVEEARRRAQTATKINKLGKGGACGK